MKIAVLSGKGGTGKTTVSVSLAASLDVCQYIDCDVEEPNGAIFLHPNIKERWPVKVAVPEVIEDNCNGCGRCGEACQFNALAVVKNKVLLFPELCHHCGACGLACPAGAIREGEREIGIIESDEKGNFLHGRLNVGEPIAIPIIRELKKRIKKDTPVIIDCSPGASCTVVQAIEGVNYCILVTEPTPFGLHDLILASKLVEKMGIPYGIVINKAQGHENMINRFCGGNNLEVLMEIPFSQEIAKDYSKGYLPVQTNTEWREGFRYLYEKIRRRAGR